MFDKEHFNTLELLNKEDRDFYLQGHNRIYQYILVLVMILVSFRIFFIYPSKKSTFKYYLFIFLGVLIVQLINSYFIFILKNNNFFNLYYYYSLNFLFLLIFSYLIFNFNENN